VSRGRRRGQSGRHQCGEYLQDQVPGTAGDEDAGRCVEWLFESQRERHHEHRTDAGTVWRSPIERWGAPYPQKPSPHFLAIHRAKTPAEALNAVLAALEAKSDEVAQSQQEYGWFVGHSDAATTVADLLVSITPTSPSQEKP